MRIRVLGCSGGVGGELRTTSLLIDEDILIDAGSGVGELSLEEMHRIHHVFLTHSHLDHFSFLPLLIDSIFPAIREPVVVHGQPETIKALQEHVFNWTIWPDFSKLPNEDQPVLRFETLTPGTPYTLGERTFEMIQVNHIVPGVGYRVECPTGRRARNRSKGRIARYAWRLNSGDTEQTNPCPRNSTCRANFAPEKYL